MVIAGETHNSARSSIPLPDTQTQPYEMKWKLTDTTSHSSDPVSKACLVQTLTKLPGPGSNPRRPISSAWGQMVLPGRRAAWQAATKQALILYAQNFLPQISASRPGDAESVGLT